MRSIGKPVTFISNCWFLPLDSPSAQPFNEDGGHTIDFDEETIILRCALRTDADVLLKSTKRVFVLESTLLGNKFYRLTNSGANICYADCMIYNDLSLPGYPTDETLLEHIDRTER